MASNERTYIAIDLKSFYASVECAERGLNAMTTNLVVADASRTSKTICLAVSPSLKSYGIPGRARLFEVEAKVKAVNAQRLQALHQQKGPAASFTCQSFDHTKVTQDPSAALSFVIAPPQMKKYMKISTEIYNIYLKYIAPEDIHVYSIDEVMIDATAYLDTYGMTARTLAQTMIEDVLKHTGITATAGIGTNLYLCKVAMDIMAKHIPADAQGVRIAELDEYTYRKALWTHEPLTDFWRVGRGIAKKLTAHGLYTMGDIARCSLGGPMDFHNEELLYKLFGINAELLIDHAWGFEPCTIKDIKSYKPESTCMSSGQVLSSPYTADRARLVVKEMADLMALDLVEKDLVTDQIVLTVGYDIENLSDPDRKRKYKGEITKDYFGRLVPKHAHGTKNLEKHTSSAATLIDAATSLYDRIVDPDLLVRRMYLNMNHTIAREDIPKEEHYEQLSLFTDYEAIEAQARVQSEKEQKEKNIQLAMLDIKKKFGKNAILKGMNLEKDATAKIRNEQVGGHKG